MNFKRITAAFLIALIPAGAVSAATEAQQTQESQYSSEYQAFEQISEYVAEKYIDDSFTKEEIMAQGLSTLLENNDPVLIQLLKSTLESMDDYSEFYTAEEYKEFRNQLNQTFYGIGISMTKSDDGYIEINGFATENSNAEKAGFEIGDKIYKVNGEDVTGQTVSEVRSKIIGEENTTVNVTVLRDGKEIELTATRVAVNESSVYSSVLDDNIGYIRITGFADNTYGEFNKALDVMRDGEVKSIILDLRNNPGGLVTSAVQIAQQIVPKGTIVDVKYRESKYDITYTSDLEKTEFDFAVLVNAGTASSSEILSSAMQDSGCAILVGTNTYGKAVIQNTFPLSNGMVFKLTIGQYITRNGKEINHIGLTPDEYVENTVGKIDTSKYTQFDFETKSALGNSSDNVKAAKERLSLMGYYSGDTESPVFDENFKDALKSFQQVNEIFSYGVLDVPTQKRMEEVFADLDAVSDNQFDTAYELLLKRQK